MRVTIKVCAALGASALGSSVWADVVTLNPVADTFTDSAIPAGNFGAAGALAIAAPGLPQGEFQSVLRFDTTSAVAAFNASFGAGNWTIQSVSLQLTSSSPNNPIFNAQAAGQFAAGWMQNDSWIEGTGTPGSPGSTGLTFTNLPSFLSASDESLGVLAFGGSTSGANAYGLGLTGGFVSDMSAGGPVSLRLSAVGSTIGYVFNSRTFGTVAARPALSITATPAPGAAGVLAGAALFAARRRR